MGRSGARVLFFAALAFGFLFPAARSEAGDGYGRTRRAWSRPAYGGRGCDSRPACANGWAHAPWQRGGTFVRRGYGGWGSWSGIRASEYGAPEAVPCAPPALPRCGYRFYRAPRWSSLVYGSRWYHPWPTLVRVDAEAESPVILPDAEAPAVPLGERPAAHDALFHGRAEEAENRFEALTRSDPGDAEAHVGLLHARFLRGDFSGAAASLRSAAALGAVSPDQRLDLPAAYGDMDSFRGRLLALRARVRFALEDDHARILLAYFESGLGEVEDARLDARQVLRSRPTDPAAKALLAVPLGDVAAPAK